MTSLTGYPSLPIAEQVRRRPIQLRYRYQKVGFSSAIAQLTTSVFIAMNPEALLPHGIASTPPVGAHLLTPNNFLTRCRARGPELESLNGEHIFDRLLPMVASKIKEATGYPPASLEKRAIANSMVIAHRGPWNQRPCPKSQRPVLRADSICTPATLT